MKIAVTSQMRRAAIFVPSNIGEGCARGGTKELLYFLSIASGSLSELDTQVEIAVRRKYLKETSSILKKIDDVFALLVGLSASLKRRS
jgi:four helix bundle protein